MSAATVLRHKRKLLLETFKRFATVLSVARLSVARLANLVFPFQYRICQYGERLSRKTVPCPFAI